MDSPGNGTEPPDKANYDRAPDRDDPRILGSSTVLKSSSKYLNHAGLRTWLATEYLRREEAAYDNYAPVLDLHGMLRELSDPEQTNAAFRAARRENPQLDRWFERGYLADYSDIGGLASLPEGTLGREFHDEFIVRRGLTPDFLPDFTPADETDYWLRRAQQTHDIHHILTDCALDNGGEVRIIGIYLGNWGTHLPPYLAGEVSAYNVLLVNAFMTRIGLHRMDVFAPFQMALTEGVAMGAAMAPIFTPDYEENWDVPVARLRRDLGIEQPAYRVDTAAMSERLLAPQPGG